MSEALAAWNGYAFDVPGGPGFARVTCTLDGFADRRLRWWARQDLNLHPMVPVEAIISAYAALVIAALDDDEPDEARRLLSLLESLGGEPA